MKNDDELSFSYSFPYFRTASAVRFFYAKKKSQPKGVNRNFLCAFGTISQNIEEGHNNRFEWRILFAQYHYNIAAAFMCESMCEKMGKRKKQNANNCRACLHKNLI